MCRRTVSVVIKRTEGRKRAGLYITFFFSGRPIERECVCASCVILGCEGSEVGKNSRPASMGDHAEVAKAKGRSGEIRWQKGISGGGDGGWWHFNRPCSSTIYSYRICAYDYGSSDDSEIHKMLHDGCSDTHGPVWNKHRI